MTWTPHVTVATIVEHENKFLLVEELSKSDSSRVLNQPAGHIEANEAIEAAALRETLEETGWSVELTGLVGFYTYTAPSNQTTYYRFCFAARAIEKITDQLDSDILETHWLSKKEIFALPEDRMRSPLVKQCLIDYLNKPLQALSIIYEHPRDA